MQQPSLSSLEHTIGYRFKNRYLLECALTHSSFANEQKIHKYSDYERLEFLGDAVLEMISSAFLFHKYPDMKEGRLSKLRASLVCEAALLPGSLISVLISVWERAPRQQEQGTRTLSSAT